MKKILEVLQYGDDDIRFNTDVDAMKNPNIVPETIMKAAFAMVTKLWGGNEQSVLAMIRAMAIADLSVSVNRKEMIRFLDESSAFTQKHLQKSFEEMEKRGIKFETFAPGVAPGRRGS